jgi:phosphoglycerate dehydrogenase-like enzyme
MRPLVTLRDVVTPYIGGATAETIDRGIATIAAERRAISTRSGEVNSGRKSAPGARLDNPPALCKDRLSR